MSLWIIILVAAILVIILVAVAAIVLRGAMTKDPTPPPPATRSLKAASDTSIASSFQSAVAVLRERVVDGSFRYKDPWVLMIGTPDSGKTSILNSLSSSALAPGAGPSPQGAGIAWGFLNQGVVIDVPGSLLLAPPGVPSDEHGWNQLLRRLNSHRPARPLDAVVLTIAAPELLDPNSDIASRGALIRAKLDQLQAAAGLVLPVYVLVTKCDRVRGFGTFCQEIGRVDPEMKKQIFGWSNNHTLESVFTWVWVDEAMTTLHRTKRAHQLRFFGAPGPVFSADELFLFPSEFQNLREPLRNFLTQLFLPVSYRDSHYFRGVYFCGLPDEPVAAGAAGVQLVAANDPARTRLPIAFLTHLFDRKIFAEKTLARPVAQRFTFRNRIVLGAQIFAAVFSLIMLVGLTWDTIRLSQDKRVRIWPSIEAVQKSMGTPEEPAIRNPTIDQAFMLVETLGDLDAGRFESIFMPASWNDPIKSRIEKELASGFRSVVLKASQIGLEDKYRTLTTPTTNAYENAPAVGCRTAPGAIDAASLNLSDNTGYRAVQNYLNQLEALEKHIVVYDRLRIPKSGTIGDVRDLLQYLKARPLPPDDRYRNNSYFDLALQQATGDPVNLQEGNAGKEGFRAKAADQTSQLISEFYRQWFDDSPIAGSVTCLTTSLNDFDQGRLQSTPDLRMLADRIHGVGTVLSGNSADWLERPFSVEQYAALTRLDASALKPVFSDDFRETETVEGLRAWEGLRAKLLQTTSIGPILESPTGARIRMTGAVQTLGSNIEYLSGLDFMTAGASQVSAPYSSPILWNADLLNEALKLNESWDKYEHDVLPTVPPALRLPIRKLAQNNLAAAMTGLVAKARVAFPSGASGDPLLAEVANFNQTLDKRKQIQEVGEKLSSAGMPLIATLDLYRQAMRLLNGINSRLSVGPLYSWQAETLTAWTGTPVASLALFKASTADDLTATITADHDRLQALVEAAGPLVQLLSAGGLPLPAGEGSETAYWNTLGVDFKQFSDKKPGNPITTLETFLRGGVDKIAPENRCDGGTPDPRNSDPFMNAMNGLNANVVRSCLLLARQRYAVLADNFNQHLAGKFPFSVDPAASVEADPRDIAAFFDLYDQNGGGLADTLDRLAAVDAVYRAPAQKASAFLKGTVRVRPLFATPDRNSLPALDVGVQFRTNQGHEAWGNQIIDWQLRIGDQTTQYQVASKPIRWHYGDHVTLTMRYAINSPRIPVATQAVSCQTIGDRRITYDYADGWSLLSLLIRNAAPANDFDNPLAAPANTVALSFGNAPAAPGSVVGANGAKLPDTIVFSTFSLQAPSAKDAPPKDGAPKNTVEVSSFPTLAPTIP